MSSLPRESSDTYVGLPVITANPIGMVPMGESTRESTVCVLKHFKIYHAVLL